MSAANVKVTATDARLIADRLLSRARLEGKKLTNALRKGMNAELIKRLEAEVAECRRLAATLQVQP